MSSANPQFYPNKRKLIYCSRTVPEIEKALAELKRLMQYREEMGAGDGDFRGMGLTSRKNTCLNPDVSSAVFVVELTAGQQGEEGQGRRLALP